MGSPFDGASGASPVISGSACPPDPFIKCRVRGKTTATESRVGIRKNTKLCRPSPSSSEKKPSRCPKLTPMVKISSRVKKSCTFSFFPLCLAGKIRPARKPRIIIPSVTMLSSEKRPGALISPAGNFVRYR